MNYLKDCTVFQVIIFSNFSQVFSAKGSLSYDRHVVGSQWFSMSPGITLVMRVPGISRPYLPLPLRTLAYALL